MWLRSRQATRSANGPTLGRSNWSCVLSRRLIWTASFLRWWQRLHAASTNAFISRRSGVLCNVVDVPEYCDFFYPAVVRRGDLQIAISTAGQSPSLAQKLRQQLERQFGDGYTAWVEQLGATRRLILASELDKETKSELLHSLASREAFEAAVAKVPVLSAELIAKGEGG